MNKNELVHYGVPGMKWGRRKARTTSEDHNRAKTIKKKKLSEMSNQELKDLNNRMNLESQYRDLKSRNVNAGRKFVRNVLIGAATVTAGYYAQKYMKKGVEHVGGKIFAKAKNELYVKSLTKEAAKKQAFNIKFGSLR